MTCDKNSHRSESLKGLKCIHPKTTSDDIAGFNAIKNGGFRIIQSKLILVILSLLLNISQCCEQTCYSAYKGGSLDLQEVQDGSPTIVPINFTGVVTIEAAYIPGYKSDWEYIRFMQTDELEPLVMQFYTPNDEFATVLIMWGEDEYGEYPDSMYTSYDHFDDKDANITIQVSDVHVEEENCYQIYLGEPGNARKKNYNYQTESNWEELVFMRLNTTTKIKTDNNAIYFKSVSVCSDDTPVVCGGSVETVAVSRGAAFNLSCSVYGAPYLEAEWSNKTLENFSELPVSSVDGFLHTTSMAIKSFNEVHMGKWECYWRNKNFQTSSTKVFYVVELVSRPTQTVYVLQEESKEQVFGWVIKNNLSEESGIEYSVLLDCEGYNTVESYSNIEYMEKLAGSQHTATVKLPPSLSSDFITCTLSLVENSGENGTEILGVLDTTTLYREGYHCEAGEYGVGEECVKCEDSFTSVPRSIQCSPDPSSKKHSINEYRTDLMNEKGPDLTNEPDSEPKKRLTTVAIIGISIGGLAVLVVLIVIALIWRYNNAGRRYVLCGKATIDPQTIDPHVTTLGTPV